MNYVFLLKMTSLTPKETEVMLVLLKDFGENYNANSVSGKAGITPRGSLKILKNLYRHQFLVRKQFGNAAFYKVNLNDYAAFRTMETLLIYEAREVVGRWVNEFRELFPNVKIAVVFGSVARNSRNPRDIDLLLVFERSQLAKVKGFINEKNRMSLRPIHAVMQSPDDIKKNIKQRDPVIMNALKDGYVLHGCEELLEIVKNVTGF